MTMPSASKLGEGAGWAMSGIIIAFMVLDAGMKLVPLDIVLKSTADLGYPPSPELARGLGLVALVSTALYALPRTAVLGAILLTAYMGGAVASHLRVGNPLLTHMLFGVYLALLAWGGLYLRDARIRALLPFRTAHTGA
jgi:hypothetical protein